MKQETKQISGHKEDQLGQQEKELKTFISQV